MNETIAFAVVFLSIVIAGCLISWVCMHGPKVVIHEHIHKYKISKDYDRLWDLIMGQPLGGTIESVAIVDRSSTIYRYNTASKSFDNIWIGCEKFPIKEKGKKEFVALCTYKNIEFLDFAEEINAEETEKH